MLKKARKPAGLMSVADVLPGYHRLGGEESPGVNGINE